MKHTATYGNKRRTTTRTFHVETRYAGHHVTNYDEPEDAFEAAKRELDIVAGAFLHREHDKLDMYGRGHLPLVVLSMSVEDEWEDVPEEAA